MDKWKFGIDNEELIDLVLKGEKTATTSLYNSYIKDGIDLPKVGDESIIIHDDNTDACKIINTNVIITEFKNITKELAYLEGEGDKSLEYYRKVHNEFFKKIDSSFNDNTKVVFEIFKVL